MLLDTIRTNGFLSCKSTCGIENNSAITVRTSNYLDWTCNSRNIELISSCQWECKQSQYKCPMHLKINAYNNYCHIHNSPPAPESLKAQSLESLATTLFLRLVVGPSGLQKRVSCVCFILTISEEFRQQLPLWYHLLMRSCPLNSLSTCS